MVAVIGSARAAKGPMYGATAALCWLSVFVVAFLAFVTAPMLVLGAAGLAYFAKRSISDRRDVAPTQLVGAEPQAGGPAGFGRGVRG